MVNIVVVMDGLGVLTVVSSDMPTFNNNVILLSFFYFCFLLHLSAASHSGCLKTTSDLWDKT